ncbi:transposase [Nocardia sp. 2YAB30]
MSACCALSRGVFGSVASDPTVSRTIAGLAADAPKVLAAVRSARASARAAAWDRAGDQTPDRGIDAEHPLIIDLDATLTIAYSEKEHAAATFKKTFGRRLLGSWADHGASGTGESLITDLRPGNAGSNTATDHKRVLNAALQQSPWQPGYRVWKKVLVRTDSGGGAHEFLGYLTARHLQYSVGSV